METTIENKMIKNSVKETIEEETLERFLKDIPDVSEEEMMYILESYGRHLSGKSLPELKIIKMDNSIFR